MPVPTIANSSFEAPVTADFVILGTWGGQGGSGWYNGQGDYASSQVYASVLPGSFGVAGAIPNGTQCCALQGTGTIWQRLAFSAGKYTISFYAEARAGALGPNPLRVRVGKVQVTWSGSTTLTPTSNTSFIQYTSDVINIEAAGTYDLSIAGTTTSGDKTSFIDSVTIADTGNPNVADANYSAVVIVNNSFELPAVSAGTPPDRIDVGSNDPNGLISGWRYSGSGVAPQYLHVITTDNQTLLPAYGANVWGGFGPIPSGTQIAVIQGLATISQTVYIPAGVYTLSTYYCCRVFTSSLGPNPLIFTVGSTTLTWSGSGTLSNNNTYALSLYTSDNFTISKSDYYTLSIAGTVDASGKSSFIDFINFNFVRPTGTPKMATSSLSTPGSPTAKGGMAIMNFPGNKLMRLSNT